MRLAHITQSRRQNSEVAKMFTDTHTRNEALIGLLWYLRILLRVSKICSEGLPWLERPKINRNQWTRLKAVTGTVMLT